MAQRQLLQLSFVVLSALSPRALAQIAASTTEREDIEEVLVLAPRMSGSLAELVEERKKSRTVSEVLSAEQMRRTGDADAAASLRRVTGLTLMAGRYVYIRGLGERYASVTLNGMTLPSPEPARRVVPLDLFPSAILSSVVVQKSYSSPISAEFGGGQIQLKTYELPQVNFLRANVTQQILLSQTGFMGGRGSQDQIGFDDGGRRLPSSIRSALGSGRQLSENNPPFFNNGFSRTELDSMSRELSNNYAVTEQPLTPMPSINLGVGKKWRRSGLDLGATTSLAYSSSAESFNRDIKRLNVGAGGSLVVDEAQTQMRTELETRSSFSLRGDARWSERHKLSVQGMILRHSSDQIDLGMKLRADDSVSRVQTTTQQWTERQLKVLQLLGEHSWGEGRNWNWNWGAQLALADRQAPDTRTFSYWDRGTGLEFDISPNGNQRLWSELSETGRELTGRLTWTPWGPNDGLEFKVGGLWSEKSRRSDLWRLHFRNRFPQGGLPALNRSIEDLLRPENRGPDGFLITNLTESADSYLAQQKVSAFYGSGAWRLNPKWELESGIRWERAQLGVDTFYYFSENEPTSRAGITMRDWLPAHSLTFKPIEDVRARLSYSETVARPELRELSTAPFIDEETGVETVGSASLRGTIIQSLDHRWEYFFSTDEWVSIGVFYKRFLFPIEEVIEPSLNLRRTFANADSAENRGLEAETRVRIGRLHRGLRRWSLVANGALIDSRVQIDPAEQGLLTTLNRPLQGQSPWVANLQLLYDRPAKGIQLTLLYNILGPRISEVGSAGRPDIYELAVDQLDVVFDQRLTDSWSWRLRAQNIMDPIVIARQGDVDVRSQRRGSNVSLSIRGTY